MTSLQKTICCPASRARCSTSHLAPPLVVEQGALEPHRPLDSKMQVLAQQVDLERQHLEPPPTPEDFLVLLHKINLLEDCLGPTHLASQLHHQQALVSDLAHQVAHRRVCLATLERAPPPVSFPIRIMLSVAPNQQPLEALEPAPVVVGYLGQPTLLPTHLVERLPCLEVLVFLPISNQEQL